MAEWGAGSFTPGVYDKTIPGAYVNIRVTPGATYEVSTRGYAAAMVNLPGGEDDAIITVTKEEFDKDAEKFFGVPSTDEALLPVRELFKNAHTLYLYRLNSGGNKASGSVGEAKFSGTNGNNITVTVEQNVDNPKKYDVITYYNGVEKDHQKVDEGTDGEVSLTKGQETAGAQIKPTFIEKWGYVKSISELDSIPGLSTKNLPADKKNVFYFHLKDQLDNGENYCAIFEVDGSKYALPIWNLKPETRNIYLWLKDDDMSGSFKEAEGSWSANTESVDITGKTVKVSLNNYGKKVTAAVLKNEPTEKLIDSIEIDCSKSKQNGEVQSGTPATASVVFDANTITVEFENVPEGYNPGVKVKNGDNYTGFSKGVIEDSIENGGLKHTITYFSDADLEGTKTVEAFLSKDGAQVINSCTYTCEYSATDTGASAEDLVDNDFVSFKKTGVIKPTGGDIFAGGTDGTATGQSYLDAKDLFESVRFNTLALATTDLETQDTFINYTIEQRDVNGVKFQLVIPECPERITPINHEGIIEYSSINKVTTEGIEDVALTYWLAGAMAGCPVQSNLTGYVYNGELDIEARVTRAMQSSALTGGKILFNKMGNDVVILRDINTLVEVPKVSDLKNDLFKSNQTVRVMDGLAVETADCFNSFFIGQNNTEVNRAELRNQLIKIRQRYAQLGAIGAYDEALMQIQPGEKLSDVIGSDGVLVSGAMEYLYFTITILAETVAA